MANDLLESDKLHLLLLSDGSQIDDKKDQNSLETATELIVLTENRCLRC